MNKFDYLFEAFNNRAYIRKTFLLSIFSIVKDTPENRKKLQSAPYALFRDDKLKQVYFFKGKEKVLVEHPNYDNALFHKNEPLIVNADIHSFVKERIETTVGIFLTNIIAIYEAVGEAGSFINGQITAGTVKALIDQIMVDDTDTPPEGKATVSQCLAITKNLDYLEGMNQVFVKASSLDVLTVHPEVIALRDKLLKDLEEQDKLNDPTAVAMVIDEVVALDAKIQLSGPSKDFFINGKFIDNARKKMFIIFDMVPDFNTGKYTLLRNSLNEGWDKKNYPGYINTAISGSYDRGNATGEGGAEVKLAILLTNRMLAIDTDCGTTRTETVTLNKYNFKGWIAGFHMVDGNPVYIKRDDTGLIGKVLNMRVPQFCKQPEGNLCRICCGEKLGGIEERLSAEVTFIFTSWMLLRMKAQHISQLKTVTIPFDEMFR